jgi:hypothetical protein
MTNILNIVGDPAFWGLVIAYWTFSAAIGALESPDEKSGKGYRWFFKFANALAANITRAFGSKIPGA